MTSETANNASGPETDAMGPAIPPPLRRFEVSPHLMSAWLVMVGLAVGAAGGASASRYFHKARPQSVLLLQPAPIARITGRGDVAVKGHVADLFGNSSSKTAATPWSTLGDMAKAESW